MAKQTLTGTLRLRVLSTLLLICSFPIYAQQLNQVSRTEILEEMMRLIEENYVDKEVGSMLIDSLQSRQYDDDTFDGFRKKLNTDVRKFSNDKHFRIIYNETKDFSSAIVNSNRKINYGFEKVEILKGNIGYLRISYFENVALAGNTARSALNFLSNTDGIIIDLRDNNGGRKSMVQLILSYFFKENSKHLYDIIGRKEVFHGYTEAHLQGKKLDGIPLYVLINQMSFSAAEMLAFILQKQKKATLIGVPTAGGGHTIGNYPISNGFSVNLPVGKVIDPISKDGWEKVGVQPDVEILNEDEYVNRAHLIALKNRITQNLEMADLFELNWRIDILTSTLEPVKLDNKVLKAYAGTYGRRIVSFSNGNLYYQGREGIEKALLIPVDNTIFRFDEVDYFRVQFVLDENGMPVALKGLYDDQFEDITSRTR